MMRLKRNDPLPLYVQLKQAQPGDILAPRLYPLQHPPSERVLSARFHFSRMTIHPPHPSCPDLLRHACAVDSLEDSLQHEYGYRLTRAEQAPEAAAAGPRETSLLERVPPAAAPIMKGSIFTEQGILIEHTSSIQCGDDKFHFPLASHPILETTGRICT